MFRNQFKSETAKGPLMAELGRSWSSNLSSIEFCYERESGLTFKINIWTETAGFLVITKLLTALVTSNSLIQIEVAPPTTFY